MLCRLSLRLLAVMTSLYTSLLAAWLGTVACTTNGKIAPAARLGVPTMGEVPASAVPSASRSA